MFKVGFILFVGEFDDEPLRAKLIREVDTHGILHEFVNKTRKEVIDKLTCVLEKRLTEYLKQIQEELNRYSPPTGNAASSLCEVNAILRRLKQAERYPDDLTENDDENGTEHLEVNRVLQRFVVNSFYYKTSGDILVRVPNCTTYILSK